MIEINLIPDVKLELLKARRQRRMVISAAILTSIVAGAVVVLLALYAFGVQTVADTLANGNIESENKKLSKVKDLSKTLTIQNQLEQLSRSQSDKNITSRLFDIISVTVPEGKNAVTIKRLAFKSEESTIDIEAEATNGYEALEVFKKTIGQTTFQYNVDGEAQEPVKIATAITDGERRYSEDDQGAKSCDSRLASLTRKKCLNLIAKMAVLLVRTSKKRPILRKVFQPVYSVQEGAINGRKHTCASEAPANRECQ